MIINVFKNYEKEITFDYDKIVNDLAKCNIKKEMEDEEISLILVDIDEITNINKTYRDKDYPTDVISFEADNDEYEEDNYGGDIFICIDKVYEQAKLYGHSVEREFAFLLCHGILHLNGYDHMVPEDEKIMFAKQEEILDKLNYKR